MSSIDVVFDTSLPYAEPVAVEAFLPERGRWLPMSGEVNARGLPERTFTARFEAMLVDHLRLRAYAKPGFHLRLRHAHAQVDGQPSYHLRTVKMGDRVLFMVDGIQVLEIPGEWPPSQVGLLTDGMKARFNGIVCFAIP